jgi:SNF2 family DNA or RNA helicase
VMDLRGKDYLEVKHRLRWFREEHPTWSIETSYLEISDKAAFANAIIKDEAGRIIATAHKYEDKVGFGDYREKAETGAIGRALALIGYGTQFCADELDEGDRIVDAPVTRTTAPDIQNVTVVEREKPLRVVPDDYVIPFGNKYKGKRLSEISERDARSYVKWLEDSAARDGKPLSAGAVELKEAVENFYRS